MSKYLKKKIRSEIAALPTPAVTPEELSAFCNSPVWHAIRHIAIQQIDSALTFLLSTDDPIAHAKASTHITVLEQFIASPDILEQMISKVNQEEVQQMRGKFRKLFHLLDSVEHDIMEVEDMK